jgi:hypothetical protein
MPFGATNPPLDRLVKSDIRADYCTMREPIPFLREAAVTLVPHLTDEQLERIGAELASSLINPLLLVSRVSDHTALIQGIPVTAESPHEADALTWEQIHTRVLAALCEPWDWDTTVTAIDVRAADGALAS